MPPRKRTAPEPDFYDGIRPPERRDRHPFAWQGVTGPLAPGRAEHLQHRRDRDRARWLGVPTFTRPATQAEQAYVAHQLGTSATSGLQTRVLLPRDGRWRRCWPLLADWQAEVIQTRTQKEDSAA